MPSLFAFLGLLSPAEMPPPQPVRTDVQVACYYFPGHFHAGRWAPMRAYGHPMPLLGYYRDGAPGVMDWQIKWAVEHGVGTFIFDWYYDYHTGRVPEHDTALDEGFLKARYRDLMQFGIFWCNEEGAQSPPYTEEEMLTLARVLGERYLGQPNYLRIEGRPVVFVADPGRLLQSFGEGFRDLLPRLSRAAGLPEGTDLYLVAMRSSDLATLARVGFAASTAYNYAGIRTSAEGSPLRASYDDLMTTYERLWREVRADGSLPYIVPVSPGWDSRPWYGPRALVYRDATPAEFGAMCRAAKQYVDPKLRMVIAECWNEFGEGSFLEPTEEQGFGALDALRDAFAVAGPFPPNVVPAPEERATWTFTDIPAAGPDADQSPGRNLLPAGDMEEGLGWLTFSQGRPDFAAERPHAGRQCLEVDPERQAKSEAAVSLQFGGRYRVSAWLRCAPGARVRVVAALFGTDGRWLGTYRELGSAEATEWTEVSAEFAARDPAVGGVDVEFVAQDGAARADDVSVALVGQADPQPLFADPCRTADGWVRFDGSPATTGPDQAVGPTGGAEAALEVPAGTGVKTLATFAAAPGAAFALRVRVRCDEWATVEVRCAEFDEAGAWRQQYVVGGRFSWQDWIEVTCPIQLPAETATRRLNIEAAALGGNAYIRDVRLYAGEPLATRRAD